MGDLGVGTRLQIGGRGLLIEMVEHAQPCQTSATGSRAAISRASAARHTPRMHVGTRASSPRGPSAPATWWSASPRRRAAAGAASRCARAASGAPRRGGRRRSRCSSHPAAGAARRGRRRRGRTSEEADPVAVAELELDVLRASTSRGASRSSRGSCAPGARPRRGQQTSANGVIIEKAKAAGAQHARGLRDRPVRVGEADRAVVAEDDVEARLGERR